MSITVTPAERPVAPESTAGGTLDVPPNWFSGVMGTGIVANAAAGLPVHVPGLVGAARVVWAAAALALGVLLIAWIAQHRRRPHASRAHLDDAVLGHFYGAPAMAMMTVALGSLLVGAPVLGGHAAVVLAAVLWTAGTLLGLVTAVALPVRLFTRDDVRPDEAGGAWLMSIVPPMVSAATGPALAAHIAGAQSRATLLMLCGALFGAAFFAGLITISMVWSRLAHHGIGAAAAVPTLWIVLGPLGQSATAAHTLAGATGMLRPDLATAASAAAVVVAVPVLGFALLWMAIAATLTVRTARAGLPFTLSWWSFTFPVGTCATGFSGLAATLGLPLLDAVAVLLFVMLVAAWLVVTTRTAGLVRAALPTLAA